MPGVLIVESMAQTAIVLADTVLYKEKNKMYIFFLGKVNVRFKKPVFPPARLKLTAIPLKIMSDSGIITVGARVKDNIVAKGEISFARKEM